MVWFQCEDCGEELKKPKLPNHFRICSAFKLSCIDCGVIFDRQSVQGHTQCITEAEKYGPKGQAKVANGTPAKPNKDKPKPDVDINVGLSDRPPWFCRLCNTKATSKQTLLLHAEGKKHRAKARAHAAAQQPAKLSEDSVPTSKDTPANTPNKEVPDDKTSEDKKENGISNVVSGHDSSVADNGHPSAKKRKVDASYDDDSSEKSADGLGNGNVSKTEIEETPKKSKKAKHETDMKGEEKKKKKGKGETEKEDKKDETSVKMGSSEEIKWKKLITSTLKEADGVLKMKKLKKLVLKSLKESGIANDDSELSTTLEQKVNASSRFTVDGKYVRLAA